MTTTTTFVASKACPCIDLWNDVKYTNFTFTQGICPDGHYSAYKAGSYNMICIPIEYGQNTCSAYDSGSSPFSDDCALPVDDRLCKYEIQYIVLYFVFGFEYIFQLFLL